MAFLQKLDPELHNFGREADLMIMQIIRTGKLITTKAHSLVKGFRKLNEVLFPYPVSVL